MRNPKRILGALAVAGLVVALGAAAWTVVARPLPGGLRPWLVGGLVPAVLFVVLFWEDVVRAVGRRQLKYGSNTLVLTASVLAILALANYVISRNTKRFDLTKGQRYSLSDQTRKVLAGLKDDIKITYFERQREMGRGQDRLTEYQALSSRLKVEYVDPVQSPAKAQAYDVRAPWPVLIVEKGDKRERITNDGEQDITNALIKITREGKKTVCLLEGEGERSFEDSGERGLSGVKGALERDQYATRSVLLAREKSVPAECTAVLLAAPETDLLPGTIDALRSYVKGGGRLLALLEPEMKEPRPALPALLKEWNVEAGDDVVVDLSGAGVFFGTSELTPIASPPYPYHAITRDFRVNTAFNGARSMEAGKGSVEGVSVQPVVQTSADSWAEKPERGAIRFDKSKGRAGPITLAVAATVRAAPAPSPSPSPSPSPADEPRKPEGRVVAFGDADFASNGFLAFPGNRDLFLNSVAWLVEAEDMISIRPKEPEDQSLFLTRQVLARVVLIALAGLPGIFVVLGIVTWWRRR